MNSSLSFFVKLHIFFSQNSVLLASMLQCAERPVKHIFYWDWLFSYVNDIWKWERKKMYADILIIQLLNSYGRKLWWTWKWRTRYRETFDNLENCKWNNHFVFILYGLGLSVFHQNWRIFAHSCGLCCGGFVDRLVTFAHGNSRKRKYKMT